MGFVTILSIRPSDFFLSMLLIIGYSLFIFYVLPNPK